MFANEYFSKAISLLQKIQTTQNDAIIAGAKAMADSIAAGRATYLFGSGHSVIPVLDAFPRYGSYIGLRPLMDPRLMWFNVIGPGGARELLWLERTEGYIANVLASHSIDARDTFVIYSHGGLNAAPVEMAVAAKAKGAKVIAVTSTSNRKVNKPTHSSGKSLHDVADIIIDNSCPPEDALVSVPGLPYKVGASSTLAVVSITMALVAQTAAELAACGKAPEWIFVSPNVPGVKPEYNQQVFCEYEKFERSLYE
jgi:uncharacterized phosphosugar-binding protein